MMDALVPGTVVASKYTVLGVLGRGGMAVVYEVMNHQLGTTCALKILSISARSVRERLLREGTVQSRLAHPNVLSVFDVIDVEGAPGLLMEVVRGPPLDRLLAETRLTFVQCDALAVGIFDGMEAAHAGGLIHRDLKPANILCSVAGGKLVPKIGDFGLAKVVAEESGAAHVDATRSGTTMGTPAYMAPEQLRAAGKVDKRADIFSLGAILYEMVTGQKAFGGDDLLELYTAVAAGRFVPPRELVPELPQRMERAILGALEPDREKRIRDCATLASVWSGEREEWSADLDRATLSVGTWDAGFLAKFSTHSHSGERITPPTGPTPQDATWMGEASVAPDDPPTSSVVTSGLNASSVSMVAGGALFLIGGVLVLVATPLAVVTLWFVVQWSTPTPPIPEPRLVEVPVPVEVPVEVPVPVVPVAVEPPPAPVVAPPPTSGPRPKPAPAPAPAPVPSPEPVVAAAAPVPVPVPEPAAPTRPEVAAGLVRVDLKGDVARVWLRSADGNFPLPADVVPGNYELIAFFDASDAVPIGQIALRPGGDRTLNCSAQLRKCR